MSNISKPEDYLHGVHLLLYKQEKAFLDSIPDLDKVVIELLERDDEPLESYKLLTNIEDLYFDKYLNFLTAYPNAVETRDLFDCMTEDELFDYLNERYPNLLTTEEVSFTVVRRNPKYGEENS